MYFLIEYFDPVSKRHTCLAVAKMFIFPLKVVLSYSLVAVFRLWFVNFVSSCVSRKLV